MATAHSNSNVAALASVRTSGQLNRVLANTVAMLLAVVTLGFCSCQGIGHCPSTTNPNAAANVQSRAAQEAERPPADAVEVRGQSPADGPIFQPHCPAPAVPSPAYGMPHQYPRLPGTGIVRPPVEQDAPWKPPGVSGAWPRDEYIHDGGDQSTSVQVRPDWTVGGLEMQDTVGHFDTLDGSTIVEPSNTVTIYAPRFAAVRQVYGFALHEAHQKSTGVDVANRLAQENDLQIATTSVQREQLQRHLGTSRLSAYRERTKGTVARNRQHVLEFSDKFLPYEDFQIIRLGQFQQSEKARLAQAIDAANYWNSAQAVQVTIAGVEVAVESGTIKPEETLQYKRPDGTPQLRVVKVASAKEAKPGDTIDFTIRFDNTGTELIGNVTIIDNLTTRLEYIEDSAECDLKANFVTVDNDGQSLILRWEITDPMESGQGGIIRFKCRVR